MPPKKRGNEIQIARGRLKGVLQDLVAPSDEEFSDESEKKYTVPTRGRPPKRNRTEQPAELTDSGPVRESYVMKLFDRSLDLAKYNETTSLYPICRAWILDQPRTNSIPNLHNREAPSPGKREEAEDLPKKLKDGTIDEITSLPAIKKVDIPRLPSPLPEQKFIKKEDDGLDLDYNIEASPISKDSLLFEHQKRWKSVRNKWMNHGKSYQQKYAASFEILEALYKQ